jgi:hypothetical protein
MALLHRAQLPSNLTLIHLGSFLYFAISISPSGARLPLARARMASGLKTLKAILPRRPSHPFRKGDGGKDSMRSGAKPSNERVWGSARLP